MTTKALLTVPDRDALRTLYDEAINAINATRGNEQLTTPFYQQTANIVFDAGCKALGDAASDTRRMITVPAPVGSGKSSFANALLVAVSRYAENRPDAPYGCVLVVEQRTQADDAYRKLSALLPGKVAVYSSDHDVNCNKQKTVLDPAARFAQDELRHFPVIVVTHKFYLDSNGHKARNVFRNGRHGRRVLTIVDERPDEAPTVDISLSEAQAVREALVQSHPETKEHLDALLRFMESYSYAAKNKLYRPGIELDLSTLTNELGWYKTSAAEGLVRSCAHVAGIERLFSFAKLLVISRGCVATDGALAHFFGYETQRVIDLNAGTILLDATADIDGVSAIVPWRVKTETPRARYDNLQIIHVRPHTKGKTRVSEYLKQVGNRRAYAKWMERVIVDHMAPGERGLVVCKKTLFVNENVPFWPERDERFKNPKNYMEKFKWEVEGRLLCATHYGAGIGCNHWNEANVVFLFDEHFLPRRIAVATTQGYRDQLVDQGDLGSMRTLNSKARGVDSIAEGHALRYTRQMALRGNARNYDDNGVCGKQRLVVAGDLKRFSANVHTMFPGARIEYDGDAAANAQWSVRVTEVLRNASLPNSLSTRRLGELLHRPWREVSRNVLTPDFEKTIGELGWRYVRGLGRKGCRFERTSQDQSVGILSQHMRYSTGAGLGATV
jgi:hypothetical protein